MTHVPHIKVEIQSVAYLGYAQAFNNVPIVEKIVIESHHPIQLHDVSLTLAVKLQGEQLCEPITMIIATLGAFHTFDQDAFGESGVLRMVFNDSHLTKLLWIESMQMASITLELTHAGEMIVQAEQPILIMPMRFWAWSSAAPRSLANIAAYSIYYHQAVTTLVTQAQQRLAKTHKDTVFSGYQGDPQNVHVVVENQVRALYGTVADLQMAYINPPASWELDKVVATEQYNGQSVRTADQVIAQKHGTCLDTTLLFAALLESVQIHPLIILIPGHAYVGYWRIPRSNDEVVRPLADIVNDIDLGVIGLIETTLVCGQSKPFVESQAQARLHLQDAVLQSEQSVCIDVRLARSIYGIKPLPELTRHADGSITVLPAPIMTTQVVIDAPNQSKQLYAADKDMPARVAQWRNQLLDLSLANRLINFRIERNAYVRIPLATGSIGKFEDILNVRDVLLHPYPEDAMYTAFEKAWYNRDTQLSVDLEHLLVHDSHVFAHVTPDRYLPTMRKIARTAKNIIDQTGVNQLYLALGSLIWSSEATMRTLNTADRQRHEATDGLGANEIPEGSTVRPGEVRSPLLLIPIQIRSKRRGDVYAMTLDDSSPIMPNHSLLEKLARELNFKLDVLLNPPSDSHGYDIPALFAEIRSQIAAERLPFRVDETCVIGFFDFGNYRLWRDLGDHWGEYIKTPLVKHMVEHQQEPYQAPAPMREVNIELDELAVSLPIPADGSQLEAIRRALTKQTFILQGPPGTGKSQTIANLIFAAMREDMRVLFVTEKSTAAQVVYDRLASLKSEQYPEGIESLVLDIHDRDSKPSAVKAQIERALDVAFVSDQTGYDVQRRTYDQYVRTLQTYPEQLHRQSKFGYSIYSARDRLLALPHGEVIAIPVSFLVEYAAKDVTDIIELLKRVQDAAANVGNVTQYLWRFVGNSLSLAQCDAEWRARFRTVVDAWYAMAVQVATSPNIQHVLTQLTTVQAIENVRMMTDARHFDVQQVRRWADAAHGAMRTQMWHHIQQMRLWAAGPLQIRDSAIDVVFATLFAELRTAENSFFLGRGQRIVTAKNTILKYLVRGGFEHFVDANSLFNAIELQQTTARALRNYAQQHPDIGLALDWNPLDSEHLQQLEDRLHFIEDQVEYLLRPDHVLAPALHRSLDECTASERQALGQFCTATLDMLEAVRHVNTLWRWPAELPVMSTLLEQRDALYTDVVADDCLRLIRWLRFADVVSGLQAYGLHEFGQGMFSGVYDNRNLVDTFERSFLQMHIHRLMQEANLDTFDAAVYNQDVQRCQSSSVQLRAFVVGIAAEQILAARRDYINAHVSEISNLRRELSRSRRQLKVRQLLSNYGEIINALMPCTIASPNSIAMLLDATRRGNTAQSRPYDLVIFDEASQIRVTHAICGIGRGDATIIVGDSRQMPPTSVAEKLFFEEDDTDVNAAVLDEESILTECVTAQVPSTTLSWHYRSSNEMLIAFSNMAYYGGKLSAFPSPISNHVRDAIVFHQVDGQYVRNSTDITTLKGIPAKSSASSATRTSRYSRSELLNTNPIEAYAVCEHVVRLMTDPKTRHLSVGILTLNEKQADLIESYLNAPQIPAEVSERFASDVASGSRGFIKSLETIQGDEADVIVMSIAFSKNEAGVLPLNFGPLNKIGGERRLNVAVTRARQQVVVFCSFAPEELRVENSSSRGIHDLRDYLMLAKHGPEGSLKTSTRKSMPDRHRDDIAQAFRARGFEVRVDYGLTEFKVDLVVSVPNQPEQHVGILLDGVRWRQRQTVFDRDVLPAKILTDSLSWRAVTRIWLPMWMRNPEAEVDRIIRILDELPPYVEPPPPAFQAGLQQMDEPRPSEEVIPPSEVTPPMVGKPSDVVTPPSAGKPSDAIDVELIGDTGSTSVLPPTPQPDTVVPVVEPPRTPPVVERPGMWQVSEGVWTPWSVRVVGDVQVLNDIGQRSARRLVQVMMQEIIMAEGPIAPKRLARLVGKAYGVERMTEDRAKTILRVTLQEGFTRDDEKFWYAGVASKYAMWRPARDTADYNRAIDEISLIELANAMLYVIMQTPGIQLTALLSETVRVFGGARVTEGIRNRLMQAIPILTQRPGVVQQTDRFFVRG